MATLYDKWRNSRLGLRDFEHEWGREEGGMGGGGGGGGGEGQGDTYAIANSQNHACM